MSRKIQYDIMTEIKERWSPRAFSPAPIPEETVMTLLEAARFAPSCNNEQPWRFLVAQDSDRLHKMRSVLNDGNRRWAEKAPVLIMILSKKTFTRNGKENYWNMFDAGTAWGFLSLEAERQGLYSHAMGGFNRDLARSLFDVSEDYNIITVVAVGKPGNIRQLDKDLLDRENPADRMSIRELLL